MLVTLGTKRVNVAKSGTLAPGGDNTEQNVYCTGVLGRCFNRTHSKRTEADMSFSRWPLKLKGRAKGCTEQYSNFLMLTCVRSLLVLDAKYTCALSKFTTCCWPIAGFTVTGQEKRLELTLFLIQTFLLYYVNHVALMLTSIILSIISIRKGRRFVSKQGRPRPHVHSNGLFLQGQLSVDGGLSCT